MSSSDNNNTVILTAASARATKYLRCQACNITYNSWSRDGFSFKDMGRRLNNHCRKHGEDYGWGRFHDEGIQDSKVGVGMAEAFIPGNTESDKYVISDEQPRNHKTGLDTTALAEFNFRIPVSPVSHVARPLSLDTDLSLTEPQLSKNPSKYLSRSSK